MDEVFVVEYDPRWPAQFAAEAARIRAALGDDAITLLEHFGSTAVPGLAAKPVIDLLVGVPSLAGARDFAVPRLEALGYSHWRDDPDPARLFFVKGLPPHGPRTHHVHLVEPGREVRERLLFRDHLRAHPAEADRYARLKRDLAARHGADREAYTAAKSAYILSVTQRARG